MGFKTIKMIRFEKIINKKVLKNCHFLPFYIDFIYRINHLLCFVCSSIRECPPLLTNRYDNFIEFRSIIHRFQFKTVYPQELVLLNKVGIQEPEPNFYKFDIHLNTRLNSLVFKTGLKFQFFCN